jgi:hypothetical protein
MKRFALLFVAVASSACGGGGFEAGAPAPSSGALGMTAPAGDAGAGDAAPTMTGEASASLPSGDAAAVDFDALPDGCAQIPGYAPGTVAACEAGVLPPGCSLEARCANALYCGKGCVYGLSRGTMCNGMANGGCAGDLKCASWYNGPDGFQAAVCIPASWVCTSWEVTSGGTTYVYSNCSAGD